MMPGMDNHYLLPASIPTAVILPATLLGAALWWTARALSGRFSAGAARWAMFATRIALGFVTLWLGLQSAARFLVLATNWPLWALALGGALVMDSLLNFYRLERRVVAKRVGAALTALRALAVLLVLGMLAQPVHSLDLGSEYRRFVAVLVDDSDSMRISDGQLTAAEKMRLGEWLGVAPSRPCDLGRMVRVLNEVRQTVNTETDWLATLSGAKGDSRQRQLETRRRKMHDALNGALKTVESQLAVLDKALSETLKPDAKLLSALQESKARLGVKVRDPLTHAVAATEENVADALGRQYESLLGELRQIAADLSELSPRLGACGDALDELAYGSLDQAAKTRIDELSRMPRAALARAVLNRSPLGADPAKGGLLTRLASEYKVRSYVFADTVEEADLTKSSAQAGQDKVTQYSNYTAALNRVQKDMTGRQCAGVVLVGDGRHTAPKAVEDAARQLGLQQVPICSVVIGSERPPVDAAIVSVDSPETVFFKDRAYFNVALKLDGLAGKEARVSLMDGATEVDSKTIRATADAFRTRIQLADTPERLGTHNYRVAVNSFDGETVADNNSYTVTTNVSDDKTRLLIIDGKPRWEFRYLKNLFADRDKTVALQYVLLEPDRIADAVAAPPMPAAASRPDGNAEANALPATAAEWMKFDAIILGDVSPAQLKPEHLDILKKYVSDRAGTLVVIAGRWYMPHAFANTPLAELLPVTFQGTDKPVLSGPELACTIALTDEGRDNVVMREKVDPQENAAMWASLPEIYWRHPIEDAKPGASVLAYAVGPRPPEFLKPTSAPSAEEDAAMTKLRQEYERKNAMIAMHNVAMGRVMFLSFDETWRLRYRVGDLYHHKFWGQVLRWATSGKLSSGTTLVRIGTDHTRYPADAAVTAQARLVNKDFSPCVSDDVYVNILQGNKQVLRRKLDYIKDSPGMYRADLGQLPAGSYTMELDSVTARALLASESVQGVSCEFSVDPPGRLEQVELAADRGLLTRLANLSGGLVAEPAEAYRVLERLGTGTTKVSDIRQTNLWDTWPLLALIVAAVTAEWVLRKKVGLA